MHKDLQQNQQKTPTPQPDVRAPEPEVPKPAELEVTAPKVATKIAEPEVRVPEQVPKITPPEIPAAKPEVVRTVAEIFAAARPKRQDFVCQFCSDEFRSETSLKMHKLICVTKKKTESKLSE